MFFLLYSRSPHFELIMFVSILVRLVALGLMICLFRVRDMLRDINALSRKHLDLGV